MRIVKLTAIAIGLMIPLGIGVAWEWSLWAECRTDHSVMYCVRVLGR